MKLTLVEKRDEASGTKSFFWQTEKPVSFIAGQFFYFTLPSLKYPDPRGATRHFTLSSSPTEGAILRMTTRIREESGFKKTLDELAIGASIEGDGPNGTFILDEGSQAPNIFLAGGIGITPFRSMIKYAIDKNLKIPLHLIYSNSIPEEIAFKAELEGLAKNYSNFRLGMTISKPEESSVKWGGPTGRIDSVLVEKFIDNWKLKIEDCTWWVSGPPAMVDAILIVLGQLRIFSNKIRSEKFTGY